jgi:hypothetical protein
MVNVSMPDHFPADFSSQLSASATVSCEVSNEILSLRITMVLHNLWLRILVLRKLSGQRYFPDDREANGYAELV